MVLWMQTVETTASVSAKRTTWASNVTTVRLDTTTTPNALAVLVTGGGLLITTYVTPTLASAPAKAVSGERTVTFVNLATIVFPTVEGVHVIQQVSNPSLVGHSETALHRIL